MSDYCGPYWCCPYCSGDEVQGDCHMPDDVRMHNGEPICEVCYNHIPGPEGMPDWYDLPGVVSVPTPPESLVKECDRIKAENARLATALGYYDASRLCVDAESAAQLWYDDNYGDVARAALKGDDDAG